MGQNACGRARNFFKFALHLCMRPRLFFAAKLVEDDLSLLNKWVTSGVSHLKIQLKVEYIPCRRHKNASSSFFLFLNKDCWKWSHQESRFDRLKHNYFWNSQIKEEALHRLQKQLASCLTFLTSQGIVAEKCVKTYAAVCSSHLAQC